MLMPFVSLFYTLQMLASSALAMRFGLHQAQETLFAPLPGEPQDPQEVNPIPKPTTPPQIVRHILPRDGATCGFSMDNGNPYICSENQYCFTSASGESGVFACCNPDICNTRTQCDFVSGSVTANCRDVYSTDFPFCVIYLMSVSGTTFSRFRCGTISTTVHMAYNFEDTPQYTESFQSAESASRSSVIEASLALESAISISLDEATSRYAASLSAQDAASRSAASRSAADQASQTGNSSSNSSDTSSTTESNGGNRLKGGAIAGVVVGTVAGVALLGGLAYFAYRIFKNRASVPHGSVESHGTNPDHDVSAHTSCMQPEFLPPPQWVNGLPIFITTQDVAPSK